MSALHDLVRKLAGDASADEAHAAVAVDVSDDFVEKLAGAIEYIIDAPPQHGQVKVAYEQASEPASRDALADVLRGAVHRRLAAKSVTEKRSAKEILVERLRGMRVPVAASDNSANTAVDPHDSLYYEDESEDDSEEESAQDDEQNEERGNDYYPDDESASEEIAPEEDSGGVAKAASATPTLADVLAASLGADEPSKSATSGGVKTAGIRGDVGPLAREAVTSNFKKKLMVAKVGREV